MTKRTNEMREKTMRVIVIFVGFFWLVSILFLGRVHDAVSHIERYEEITESFKKYDTETEKKMLKREHDEVQWLYNNAQRTDSKTSTGERKVESFIDWWRFLNGIFSCIVVTGYVVIVIGFVWCTYQDYKRRKEAKKSVKVHYKKSRRLEHFSSP